MQRPRRIQAQIPFDVRDEIVTVDIMSSQFIDAEVSTSVGAEAPLTHRPGDTLPPNRGVDAIRLRR